MVSEYLSIYQSIDEPKRAAYARAKRVPKRTDSDAESFSDA